MCFGEFMWSLKALQCEKKLGTPSKVFKSRHFSRRTGVAGGPGAHIQLSPSSPVNRRPFAAKGKAFLDFFLLFFFTFFFFFLPPVMQEMRQICITYDIYSINLYNIIYN